jgi:Flp pilus assembly protein TadD
MKSFLQRIVSTLLRSTPHLCVALIGIIYGQTIVGAEPIPQNAASDATLIATAAEKALSESRFTDAVRLYTLAVERNPSESSFFLGRGTAHEMVNQNRKAEEDYRTAITLDRGNFRAMEKLAGLYERQGARIDEVIPLYKRALELDPRPVWKEYLAFCVAMMENRLQPADSSAVACWNRGNENAVAGKEAEAEFLYSRAVEVAPHMFQAYFSRGLLRMRKRDFESAVKDFDVALRLCPRLRGCLVQRAMAHDQLGSREKAFEDLEQAVKVDPRDPEAHYRLGVLWEGRNEFTRARECYLEALRLKPKGELRKQVEDRAASVQGMTRAIGKRPGETPPRSRNFW